MVRSSEEELRKHGKYGYDFYPERKDPNYKPSFAKSLFFGEHAAIDKSLCRDNINYCLNSNKLVQLMIKALASSGCPVRPEYHIVCEKCDAKLSGGYDTASNQIVVCQNISTSPSCTCSVLVHEMIHMFDRCKHKMDFKNLRHVACSEIRAANLTHCSIMGAFLQGSALPWRLKKHHSECVKDKAMWSIAVAHGITYERAREIVNDVFDKCYKDLEPIGRRYEGSLKCIERAYYECKYYGYH